jgi:hypothetical protein
MVHDQAGRWSVTDENGAFNVRGLPPGKHLLTPSKPGFKFYPPSVAVDVSGGSTTAVRFVGAASVRNTVYLPLALNRAGR